MMWSYSRQSSIMSSITALVKLLINVFVVHFSPPHIDLNDNTKINNQFLNKIVAAQLALDNHNYFSKG
jgi:low affinity Fe/Cu permease